MGTWPLARRLSLLLDAVHPREAEADTPEQMADRVGIPPGVVRAWLDGGGPPVTAEQARRIGHVYGVPAGLLLEDDEDPLPVVEQLQLLIRLRDARD